MTTTENPKLDTIRRLLDLADESSGTSDAERELAANRAVALMAKYAVTEAMLDAARGRQDDPVESRQFVLDTVYTAQKKMLLRELAANLQSRPLEMRDTVIVFGHRSDLERLDFLYTLLLTQALSSARRVRDPRIVKPHSSQTRAYRSSWLNGFVMRVGERMAEGRTEAVADAGSGAELVLVNRKAAADAALHAEYPKTRSRAVTIRGTSGYQAGRAAGERADLGQSRVGGRRAIG